MQPQRSPKINFREIFWVVRFSTFATISARSGRFVSEATARQLETASQIDLWLASRGLQAPM